MSILAANEDYGADDYYELATTGLTVVDNRILACNSTPRYDGSYGNGGGAGDSVFNPNATFTEIDDRWCGPFNSSRAP